MSQETFARRLEAEDIRHDTGYIRQETGDMRVMRQKRETEDRRKNTCTVHQVINISCVNFFTSPPKKN